MGTSAPSNARYRRVLLKLSGEALMGERPYGVDPEVSRMGDPVPPLFWLRDPEGNTLMVVG